MNKGLRKLALADDIATPNLYAKTEISAPAHRLAAVTDENSGNGAWGIQVGAFSNYAKARNYAISVRRQINNATIRKAQIDIEPAQKGAAIIYRSKLIGLEKNEADKTCNHLKKSNKSCIVVASNQNQQLAMAENH